MKNRTINHITAIVILIFISLLISCNSNECTTEEFDNYFTEAPDSGVDMAKGREKIISKKGNIETVEESDSCGRTLYLYQRLRLYKDSTILNGLFKAFYVNGRLRYSINYKKGEETGYGKEYWLNGNLKYKTYKVGGIPSGPQFKYDSSGVLQEVRFRSTSNHPYWLRVVYDKEEDIDSLDGQTYYFFPPTRIKKEYKVGERVRSLLFIPKLRNTITIVKMDISNKNHSFDTVINKAFYHLNAKCVFLDYRFETEDKGINRLKMIASLYDSTRHSLIKEDSFFQVIHVD